ncbi:hypothetical protein HYFRA_00006813 [Hymenoscyphus fraxineus]|uniref:Enoyl reductase (ER) domain-containing protein n=1 Tax=Hymenoscyphus fraxineus TaxID=746836 RepID=A0A9N9KM81_9HELO|nr:hypothetical protein HYFRA_00006813 [Hymenoscyphus fraxineus]
MSTQSLPKVIRAITLPYKQKVASIQQIPIPPSRPDYITVKIHSVALNPTDWKHIHMGIGGDPYSIVGCDFSGTVVSIGDKVTKQFKIGEEVYGVAHGGNANNSEDGVFGEYAVVKGDLVMRKPENLSFEDASTIPLGTVTVAQGLFQKGKGLGLELPGDGKGNGEWVLIYGGSTATGTLGIQFAKLAGYKVITTCSPRNHELVKSRGADEVFDYNASDAAAKIRELTGNKLKYAWDTVGIDASAVFCAEALSSEAGGHFGTILQNKIPRDDVKQTGTIMYTIFGETYDKFGIHFPASKEDFEFAKVWTALSEKLVAEGKVKPHPAQVGKGGLEGVLQGLEDLKNGKVSGNKLVYNIEG